MLKELVRIYEYREMLFSNVRKELRARYKGSFLGFLWTFINPLLSLIVYSIVFSTVMRIKVPNYNYTLFLFIGLITWSFTATSISQSSNIIINNSNLVKKIYFPRMILPLSVTMTNLINMLFSFIILFIALWTFSYGMNMYYILLPLVILIQTILVLGLSLMLAAFTVYFRDLEHIMSIVVMTWFYLTPIVYTTEYIPSQYISYFRINPMLAIIDSYRDILLFNRVPDFLGLVYVVMFSVIILLLGCFAFHKLQKRFAEEI